MSYAEVNEKERVLQKKAKYFLDSGKPVHIVFKKGYWKRGNISEIGDDFFILNEFREGELVVFFLELDDIYQFNSLEKK